MNLNKNQTRKKNILKVKLKVSAGRSSPRASSLQSLALCNLVIYGQKRGQRGKGSFSRMVGDWGPTFHSWLPPPKLVSTISLHSNAQGHILSQGQRRQTHCCQDSFSLIWAQLRSRSMTPTPGSESPLTPNCDYGEGLGLGAAVLGGSNSAQGL